MSVIRGYIVFWLFLAQVIVQCGVATIFRAWRGVIILPADPGCYFHATRCTEMACGKFSSAQSRKNVLYSASNGSGFAIYGKNS